MFPQEAEKAKKAQLETIKKAVGLDSSRFITESQVASGTLENGALSHCHLLVVSANLHDPNFTSSASLPRPGPISCQSYFFAASQTVAGKICMEDVFSLSKIDTKNATLMQLEAIKQERGPSVEDGTIARDKTLAAILAENKAKKEEQFANVWKSMKQGDMHTRLDLTENIFVFS